ncbi:MAG: ATP-binding cassette domain-containing protein [Candidatus Lokiarchaeota archaeon]|nr:ATP-binding cassette domain-containing protein [Candidatus Lokiarchaeota archaeon]MBD3339838.1 ATP-binding cassette domain-containing protein [Candidatus Lokiarchaeota archaeon]
MITFNNFYFRYRKNKQYQLNNINLKIEDNKFILLAGPTGSGKTTLIRSLNGLIPQFYAGFYRGNVKIGENKKDTANIPISELSKEIGVVFQNPENQLISMNVEHELAFGMENLGVPYEEMNRRIEEAIRITEIQHLLDKAPFELSGGEQQRVAIASILVLNPKIIVLDEPTALLDPYMAEKIINLLKKIQIERNLTVIISEHRMDLIIPLVDEIILIDDGKILEHGRRDEVINGNNFESLEINKPVIYEIFHELKKEGIFSENIPSSIENAILYLKQLN